MLNHLKCLFGYMLSARIAEEVIRFFYSRALMDIFPDAKVILTIRDPEKWFESVKRTIYQTNDFLHGAVGWFLKLVGGYDKISLAVRASNQVHPIRKYGKCYSELYCA